MNTLSSSNLKDIIINQNNHNFNSNTFPKFDWFGIWRQQSLFFSCMVDFVFFITSNLLPFVMFFRLTCDANESFSSFVSAGTVTEIKATQLTFTCSNSTIEKLEQGVKYVQNYHWKHQNDVIDVVLVFLLFHFEHISDIFLVFLYCWLWTIKF